MASAAIGFSCSFARESDETATSDLSRPMTNPLAPPGLGRRVGIRYAGILLVAGSLINFFVERHSFLRVGVVSLPHHFGGWGDFVFPMIAIWLTSSGAVLLIVSLVPRRTQRAFGVDLFLALLISAPLTLFYGTYFMTVQFFQTGSDSYGDCSGLENIAASETEIPASLSMPGRPAVGCRVERYGMFLWPFNSLTIYGVTQPAAQKGIVESIRKYRRDQNIFPVRIMFYEKENWVTWRSDKTGVTGPSFCTTVNEKVYITTSSGKGAKGGSQGAVGDRRATLCGAKVAGAGGL